MTDTDHSTRALTERLLRDRSGAAAAEYALLLTLIFLVIVVAATALGVSISTIFANFATMF